MTSISFIWKDLLRRRFETLFSLLGISFAVAALFILFSLQSGIRHALLGEQGSRLSEITVYASSSGVFLNFLNTGSEKTLTPETLQSFEKIPGVIGVKPHMIYGNLASVEMSLGGQKLQTDSLIFGTTETRDEGLGLRVEGFAEQSAVIPVVISRKLIDLYNLSLAPSGGLPQLSEDTFTGKDITIFPGHSSFFGDGMDDDQAAPSKILKGRIVGFSDSVDLIGITVPIEVVRELNRAEGRTEETYNKVFVTASSPRDVPALSKFFEDQGYRVSSIQQEIKEVGRSLGFIDIIFGVVGAAVVFLAILIICGNFWSSLAARSNELGILRAIGVRKNQLMKIFLSEAVAIGAVGGVIGIALGELLALFLANIFPPLFSNSLSLSLELMVWAIFLSLGGSMMPILKMAGKKPVDLL